MSGVIVVSGTDTGIGKTVAAAGLAAALGAHYWKPIQAGTEDGTDTARAGQLGARVLPEAYRLELPASPHLAAEREGLALDPARLALPPERPLVVEGAGGLMVPIRRAPPWLMIDQFACWRAPVLLVARTGLGTINHSLLSIAALRARGVPIAGLLFVGEAHGDNEALVPALGGVRSFGRLPMLDPLDAEALARAMTGMDLAGIRQAMGA
jgi:dethiobiotin synthetase